MLLSLQILPRQEQKHLLRQEQTLLVRCLIVHYRTDKGPVSCALPIHPDVSTRMAKKTGYDFVEVEMSRVEDDRVIAISASHFLGVPLIPKELEGIVQVAT